MVHYEGFLASVLASMHHYSSFQSFRHINICLILLILRCKWHSFKNQINSKHKGPWNLTEACLKRINVLVGPEKEDLERKHLPFPHSQSLREVLNTCVRASALAWPLPSAPVQPLETYLLILMMLPNRMTTVHHPSKGGVLPLTEQRRRGSLVPLKLWQQTAEDWNTEQEIGGTGHPSFPGVTGHLPAPNMPAGWFV